MKSIFSVAALFFVAKIALAQGVIYPKKLVVANGGQYGNSAQNVVVQNLHLYSQSLSYADTINTESVQNIIVDGKYGYLAAQDSIYKIDLETLDIQYSSGFPGVSTSALMLNDSLLWVGNAFGATSDNLYAFRSDDLSLVFSVNQVSRAVNSMALLNDTLIVTQNLTSSSWTDSAGFVALVDVSDGSFLGNIPLHNVYDAGWVLVNENEDVFFVNPASDTYGYFDNSTYVTDTFGRDLASGYGAKIQLEGNILIGIFDNEIGVFDLATETYIVTGLIDSVSSFVFDPIESIFYTSYTDFNTIRQGAAYDTLGQKLYDFNVGYSPEAIALYYAENMAPVALDKMDTTFESISKTLVIAASDPNNDPLETSIVEQAKNGTATVNNDQNIEYTPNASFYGLDSLTYEVCDTELPEYAKLCEQAKAYVWVDQSVGILQLDLQNSFDIYPNPASYSTTMNVKEAGNYDLRILSLNGQLQFSKQNVFIDNNYTIDLQNLASGQYLILLENEENVQIKKLVKE